MYGIAILLGLAIGQNAPPGVTINCKDYSEYNITQSWQSIALPNPDVFVILFFGTLAEIGLVLVFCTYLFIKQSRESPGEIFMLLSFFNFLNTTSCVSSAIYVNNHRDSVKAPVHWDNYCYGVGIINIIGGIGVDVYNIMFCVYTLVTIQNTLKGQNLKFYHYHIICFVVIAIATLLFHVTDNIGVSVNGICSYKLNSVTPYISFSSFCFYIIIAVITIRTFKRHVPQIKILTLQRQEFFNFFYIYLMINTILTFSLSVLVITIDTVCQINGQVQPGIITSLINFITIVQAFLVVYVRLRHPLIKTHFRQLYKSMLQRNNADIQENTYFFSLKETIKLFNCYNFLSVIRISYKYAPYSKRLLNYHYVLYIDDKLMKSQLAVHQIYQDFNLPQAQVTFYCCGLFKHLAKNLNLDPFKSLAVQSNQKALRICSSTDGGKSGQFFFISQDKKFILKTIKVNQLNVFLKRASSFSSYFTQRNCNSLIIRFTGIFSISYRSIKNDLSLVLMPNLKSDPEMQVLRTFDLKGSKYMREVIKHSNPTNKELSQKTLKDNDFINHQRKIMLSQTDKQAVQAILRQDCAFLSNQGLMDYSLLVIKVIAKSKPQSMLPYGVLRHQFDQNIFYIIGIIDFLQVWNLQKYSELQTKRVIVPGQIQPQDISSQEPHTYRERFQRNVIDRYFE